jgi:hypothetical protein
MTSFQEFLHKKAEEQRQSFRREKRDEWIVAVRHLLDQIQTWLKEADPEGLLDFLDLEFEKAEVGLGRYKVPGLKIGVGDLAVQVVPVARNVVGSSRFLGDGAQVIGRVDITDGIRKYILRRIQKEGSECWEVMDEEYGTAILDRPRLEAILQDLLA